MEQSNNVALNLLQTVASQTQLPRTGKSDGDSDFQKLMDKAQSGQPDSGIERPKAEKPAAVEKKDAPVEQEDALSKIKKMLEQQGAFAYQPNVPCVCVDAETGQTTAVYNPGEYVLVHTGEGTFEMVPTLDLEPWQQVQLKQLLLDPNPIDVSDPKVDAMLEATAPGADNSPAALLDRVVTDQFGKVMEKTVEEVQPQLQEDDGQIEAIDADQGPQQLFHDVKAAPVKVGETYDVEQADKADVAQQIDAGLAQALEKGESMVRIQLTPENLGSVTVEITRSAEGLIRVALNAHSGETRSLLERHAGELQGMLSNRTQQDVEVSVQQNQESQQNQNQHPYDGRNGHGQSGQEERRQPRREQSEHGRDFMQQLRLGLIPAEE